MPADDLKREDIERLRGLGITPEEAVVQTDPKTIIEVPIPPEKIAKSGTAPETDAEDGDLQLTIEDAVITSFQNNRSIEVEKLTPGIRHGFECGLSVEGCRIFGQRQGGAGFILRGR